MHQDVTGAERKKLVNEVERTIPLDGVIKCIGCAVVEGEVFSQERVVYYCIYRAGQRIPEDCIFASSIESRMFPDRRKLSKLIPLTNRKLSRR